MRIVSKITLSSVWCDAWRTTSQPAVDQDGLSWAGSIEPPTRTSLNAICSITESSPPTT